MGPRSLDRGELTALTAQRGRTELQWGRGRDRGDSQIRCGDAGPMLQWGRGHVTAERSTVSGLHRRCPRTLQWGRGHVTAEIESFADRSRGDAASMGPRSRDRGDDACDGIGEREAHERFNGAAVT